MRVRQLRGTVKERAVGNLGQGREDVGDVGGLRRLLGTVKDRAVEKERGVEAGRLRGKQLKGNR